VATLRRSYAALLLGLALGTAAAWISTGHDPYEAEARADVGAAVKELDGRLGVAWDEANTAPAPEADERTIARRMSLALTGSVPSLEELRAIERAPAGQGLDQHLDRILRSRRFADYFAERLARAYVGTDDGPFLVFRRRRFVYWLSDAIHQGMPYDQMVGAMVAGTGLWTDKPETNFITAHERDPVALTARTTRAFLGMRLDCAQCHDHPFSHWKQSDFEGLAAHYAGVEQGITGITDGDEQFRPGGRMMEMNDDVPAVEPAVPFAPEGWPDEGSRRMRLARWIVSPQNEAFGKAIANRVWTLLLGKSLTDGGVDDIESAERVPGALALLGRDFADNGHDLKRLVRVIARSRAFRVGSVANDAEATQKAERTFASFPLTKLRGEQIAGSLVQLSRLTTVDADSHIVSRLMRFGNINDFVDRYGDAGEDELREQTGTIMQSLTMMNGRIVRERIEADLFSTAKRIASLAPDDATAVEVAFLTGYARTPSEAEARHFVAELAGKKDKAREDAIEDMLWAIVNATEFSWNH
jgi:hypothetical protein